MSLGTVNTTDNTEHMRTAQRTRFPWGALTALYSFITFLMLGIDMALLHLGYRHYHLLAILPIVFCAVAALVSLATAFSAWLRRQAWVLGMFAMIIGTVGTIIHLEIAFSGLKHASLGLLLEHLVFDPRPPLAPAALAGTGLLLFFIAIAERWPVGWVIAIACRIPIIRNWFIVK